LSVDTALSMRVTLDFISETGDSRQRSGSGRKWYAFKLLL
jgi:hypothetical protein